MEKRGEGPELDENWVRLREREICDYHEGDIKYSGVEQQKAKWKIIAT